MKKFLVSTTIAFSVLASSAAEAKMTTWDYLKDYGLPCAAGFLGGMLASKDSGAAIGVGVCLGVGTATYLNSERQAQQIQDSDVALMKKMLTEQSQVLAEQQDKKVQAAIRDMEARQEKQMEATRQIMKEVIAERMALLSDENKTEIRRYLEQKGTIKDMEAQIRLQIQQEFQNPDTQKKIIEKCVDETLNQVMVKRVGVPGDTQPQQNP